ENRQQQPEGRDELGEPLTRPGAHFRRNLPKRQVEHEMRRPDADHAADDLRGEIGRYLLPRQFAPQSESDRHRWIEMGAGNRPEDQDQHDQDGAGGNSVAQKRQSDIAAGEIDAHHARADDGCKQESRAEKLSGKASGEWLGPHARTTLWPAASMTGSPSSFR